MEEIDRTTAQTELLPPSSPALSALDRLGPAAITSLLFATAVRRGGAIAAIFPEGEAAVFTVRMGSARLDALPISADVATAAIVRLARLSGLDPLAEAGTTEGRGNLRRVSVKVDGEDAEVLVGIDASSEGLRAEVRALLVNGVAPSPSRPVQLKRCVVCDAYQLPQRETCEIDGGRLIELLDDPRPGGTIGVYLVGEELGDGAMGTVFAATHALLGRPVAIKLLHLSAARNPVLVRRFLSEARAASLLRHPNIVEVTDFGLLADQQPFLVMERLDGESLEASLRRSGALPPKAALLVARVIAVALGAAHEGGVVHNDLKPANVLLLVGTTNDAPQLKLVDFGAASLLGAQSSDGFVVGTPRYMAPEHARGEPTDGRADLYSLGVVLYEMLAGSPPFVAPLLKDLVFGHLNMPPPTLRSPHGTLPLPVTRLVDRLLRKHPAERHQNAAEVVADIQLALASLARSEWKMWLP